MIKKPVFFIVGSVRSGTTLLRDILKSHPNLLCPEETHFFRWSEPFASGDYNHVNQTAEVLKMHRSLDKVKETDFLEILENAQDRRELQLKYFELFSQSHNQTHLRCFDKTPQNIYGLPLIKAYFPEAKIIHIVRNPLNVISSLVRGRSLSPQTLTGAINFWKEALLIVNTMKPILGENLYEFKYEDLTENPIKEISDLLNFLSEDIHDMTDAVSYVKPAMDSYFDVLDQDQINTVKAQLSDLMQLYNY
jgi:hypothetical protein